MPSKRPATQADALAKLTKQAVAALKRPDVQAGIAAAFKSGSGHLKSLREQRALRPPKVERSGSEDRFSLPLGRERLERRITAMEENLRLLGTELGPAADLTGLQELLRRARLKLKMAEEMSLVKRTKVHLEVDDILDQLDTAVLAAIDGDAGE